MAINGSSRRGVAGGFFTWLGGLLMALVADEDARVRGVIARTAMLARPGHNMNLNTRWRAWLDPATDPRVE